MEYRNARYTSDGRIDCEVKHPKYGWIPMTANENDSNANGAKIFKEIKDNGDVAEYVKPDPEEVLDRKRKKASLPKEEFILSALDLGIFSEDEAEKATDGWPESWDTFFEESSKREKIQAKARWADAKNIFRDSILVKTAAEHQGVTEEELDEIFKIKVDDDE